MLGFREFLGFRILVVNFGRASPLLATDSPAVEPCGDSLFYGGVSTG